MAALRVIWVAAALVVAAPAHADTVASWRPYIAEASHRYGIPEDWISRVMRAESGGQTRLNGRPIRSRAGAIGLMQIMPGTWSDLRAQLGLGSDPDDPHDNILAGTFYLRLLYDRFGYPGLFGAYNAGPARYAAYLAGRQRLPGETIGYLAAVGTASRQFADGPERASPPRLFALRREAETASTQQPPDPALVQLFAIRRPGE